jgi:FkbM family methyltransferase
LRASLADELSRRTLDAFLALRLTLHRERILEVYVPPDDEYFSVGGSSNTFRLNDNEAFCDAGAYKGTVTQKFIAATGGVFDVIHAFEPDSSSFSHLCKLASLPFKNIHLHPTAVGDRTGSVFFQQTGTMGSHVSASQQDDSGSTVAVTKLDDVMDRVTFIKMDLEGFEQRALRGASRLIEKCRPRMAITGYHYADDLLDICSTITHLMPGCQLRLRQHHLSLNYIFFYAHG